MKFLIIISLMAIIGTIMAEPVDEKPKLNMQQVEQLLEQIEKEIEFERNCLCSNETRMSCLVEEKNFWQQKSKSDPDIYPLIDHIRV